MKLSPKLKIGIVVVLLIAFFVVLNLTGFSKEVRNFFYFISSPIQKVLWQAGDRVSDFFEAISEIKSLKKETEELKLKNQELMAQIVSLKELQEENEFLRQALEIGLEKEFKLVLAEIIGKDISQDFLLIDKGANDGIVKDMPVITQQKVLVGKISEIYEDFSKVMLISNKKSSFSAKVQDYNPPATQLEGPPTAQDIEGVVKGKGGLNIFLDLVPRDKELSEGDIVVTSALGGVFPKGILVGEVKEIQRSDIEPFQTAEINPAFDIKEIKTLFIISEY